MTGKIEILRPTMADARTVLLHAAEADGLDGVIAMIRKNGKWTSVWGGDVTLSALCMASLKMQHDLVEEMNEQ